MEDMVFVMEMAERKSHTVGSGVPVLDSGQHRASVTLFIILNLGLFALGG